MRPYLLIAASLLALTTPGLASPKPCRDAQGRIMKCLKPAPIQQRCKDAQGRFIKCEHPKPQG